MLQIPVIILVVFFISRKPVTTDSITPEFTEAIHWPGCTLDRIKDRSIVSYNTSVNHKSSLQRNWSQSRRLGIVESVVTI